MARITSLRLIIASLMIVGSITGMSTICHAQRPQQPELQSGGSGVSTPGMFSNMASSPGQSSDVSHVMGESFTMRVPEKFAPASQIVVGNEEVLFVENNLKHKVNPDGTLKEPVNFIKCRGLKIGETEVTFIGVQGMNTVKVEILPSIEHLEAVLAKHFPNANLKLEAGGNKLLILEGEVSSPAEIEPILVLMERFIGANNVVNALKVKGVTQVQLEVMFISVNRTEERKLGVNFAGSKDGNKFFANQVGNVMGVPNVLPPTSGITNPALNPVGALSPSSTLFVGVSNASSQFFSYIQALKIQGVVKVLANPTLVTLSGRPAEFLSGGEQPFPTASSSLQAPGVDFKKFGTRLNFLPVVLGEGMIRMELVPEVSTIDTNTTNSVNLGGYNVPQIRTQKIHATVEMHEGETLVLGGIMQTQQITVVNKIPVLGDIPGIGVAFRKVDDRYDDIELMVMVTPRLVSGMKNQPLNYPGAETRRSTDCEFFLHGMPEMPVGCPYPQQECPVPQGAISIDPIVPQPQPINAKPIYIQSPDPIPVPLPAEIQEPMLPMQTQENMLSPVEPQLIEVPNPATSQYRRSPPQIRTENVTDAAFEQPANVSPAKVSMISSNSNSGRFTNSIPATNSQTPNLQPAKVSMKQSLPSHTKTSWNLFRKTNSTSNAK